MSRRIPRRRAFAAALTLVAVAAGGTAYAGATEPAAHLSHAHGGQVIRLVEASQQAAPTVVDTGEPGLSPGDQVVVADDVTRNGAQAGRFSQHCTLIVPAANLFASTFECEGSIALAEGTITVAGPFVPAKAEQSAAITGGTGAFRTARGEVAVRAEADELIVRLYR